MMTLALKMGRTVRELEASMTATEFQDWVAFNEIDPFTSDRGDLRAAITAHAAAASNGASCKVSDFVPDFNRQPVEQDEGDIMATAMKITRLMGGNVSR